MSYETAPATILLATDCCVCGRPLVDSDSVNTGIGPVCAKRTQYGHFDREPNIHEAANLLNEMGVVVELLDPHKAANKLVYLVAANQKNTLLARKLTEAVALMGYTVLANVLRKRFAPVTVTVKTSGDLRLATIEANGNENFHTALNLLRYVPGKSWDKKLRANTFPISSRGTLWKNLKKLPSGSVVEGDKGVVVI